uniref:Uncharacterized protein n=1 Tax=Parascaris equorum TaxID=6256 RepID=A0A914S1Q7_PAREQ
MFVEREISHCTPIYQLLPLSLKNASRFSNQFSDEKLAQWSPSL